MNAERDWAQRHPKRQGWALYRALVNGELYDKRDVIWAAYDRYRRDTWQFISGQSSKRRPWVEEV